MPRNGMVLTFFVNSHSNFLRKCFTYVTKCSKRRKSSYFVTTPIFYVNASPHIGHLYTSVIADAVARFQKLKNPDVNVKFMTGTDEHGMKVSLCAQEKKMNEKDFCDMVANKFKQMCDGYNISYTDFLRTTEQRHEETVKSLWTKIFDRGYIYSAEYEGWYCISDETFVTEKCLQPEENSSGVRLTIEGNKPTQFVKEKNYKFKLSHFQKDLLHWLKQGNIVKPKKYEKILQGWIEDEDAMADLSVSRPAMRVRWGIPVPNDPSQNIYVWMDALSSYLTSSEFPTSSLHWPPDLHVIGKDILRFHGIFWPAFLIAADMEPPKGILCHAHWMNDGQKMSKSVGNVVDPMEKMKLYTNEGFRFFLLKEGVPNSDGNYHESEIPHVLNSSLAGQFGNLLNRACGKSLNPQQVFPGFSGDVYRKNFELSAKELIQSLEMLPDTVYNHYEDFDFYKGIAEIWKTMSLTNQFFQIQEPWTLKKKPECQDDVRMVIHLSLESLRVCGILLQPIVPKLADNLLNQLSISRERRSFESIRPFSWQTTDTECRDVALQLRKEVLFRKLESK